MGKDICIRYIYELMKVASSLHPLSWTQAPGQTLPWTQAPGQTLGQPVEDVALEEALTQVLGQGLAPA